MKTLIVTDVKVMEAESSQSCIKVLRHPKTNKTIETNSNYTAGSEYRYEKVYPIELHFEDIHIRIGYTSNVDKKLFYPVECMPKLLEDLYIANKKIVKLDSNIFELRKAHNDLVNTYLFASFWQRLKYLFTGKINLV